MRNCLVYMTAETPREARDIGRALIEARLAACVNIIEGMKSLYWWEGRVEEGAETVVIAKTREDAVPRLTAKVKEMHGYDCPCVVSLPIEGGNPDFLSWIEAETE
jgi:periplasmic divalent cation tolerance protein